jgi:CheY-like chemotaxis protein
MLNQSRRYKILIVDEDNFDKSTLNMLIGDEFDTIFAYDGHEAVETYFVEKPDLVFMSIVIPVKNGFESLDEIEMIEKNKGRKRKPIIACSIKMLEFEREYLINYGFDDYLSKPYKLAELKEILRFYLNRK